MGAEAATFPVPLVKLTQQPARWLLHKVQLLVSAAVLASVGMVIVVAGYYLAFEVNPTMTTLWHRAIGDDQLRHNIRNVGEGLLGGLLAQLVVWNHFKRRRSMNLLDRFEIALGIPNVKDARRLSIWQLLVTPVLVLLYATPGFFVALGTATLIHHNTRYLHNTITVLQPDVNLHVPPHEATLWSKTQALWTQNWDKKLMGYGASLVFGRRPAKKVFDDGQLWFAERRVNVGKTVRWYHTPTFKARYNVAHSNGGVITHSHRGSLIMRIVMAVGAGLAVFGGYVLIVIAGQ